MNLLFVNSRVSQTTAGVSYTSDDDFIYLNGTKNGQGYATLSMLTIALEPGTYYARAFALGGTASKSVGVYGNDDTSDITGDLFGKERTFVVSTAMTLRFRVLISADGTVLTNYKIGIVVSKTSGIDKFYTYANLCPISGHTGAEIYHEAEYDADADPAITVTFPETIYGGEDEVISGKLKSTMGMVDLGTLSWSYSSGRMIARISDIKPPASNFTKANAICSMYPITTSANTEDPNYDKYLGVSRYGDVCVRDSSYTDAATFKAAMSGVQLCYELAEPVEYTLTGNEIIALDGTNVIWANTGDVTVTYIAKSAKFSFGSPLHNYNYNNLKLFGNTYIEHGKG